MLEILANNIALLVIKALRIQLVMQGHKLTGALEKSIEQKVKLTSTGVNIQILLFPYGIILDRGVKPSRIPFSLRRTGRGTSKYIQGLQRFAKKRFFVSDKEALRIAFAIARKQKQEGMPTKGSFKFSKTGKRTGAFDAALEDVDEEIDKLIENTLDATITEILT